MWGAWLSAARWQLSALTLLWVALGLRHLDNDGLWFQGDAPRHAANGVFFQEWCSEPTWRVREYALSFYARYPVINPVSYPPAFYLAEAGAYTVAGRSPAVAKGLVLLTTWLGMFYCWRWLRRFQGPAAGWGAGLWLMAPGIVSWSHAIMLNVPATALSMMALYYGRLWLSEPGVRPFSRTGLQAGAAMALSVATYYHAAVVILVWGVWGICLEGDARRRRQALLGFSGLALLAALVLGLLWKVSRVGAGWSPDAWLQFSPRDLWGYYAQQLVLLSGLSTGALAIVGWGSAYWNRAGRHELAVSATTSAVLYVAFSALPARDSRYALLIIFPTVCAAVAGLQFLLGFQSLGTRPTFRRVMQGSLVAIIGVLSLTQGYRTHVPRVEGFAAVADFLRREAGQEAVLYDGYFNGIFSYYRLIGDPDRSSLTLLGNKHFYTYAHNAGWKSRSFVENRQDIIARLQHELGCRWVVLEQGKYARNVPEMELLRETVTGSEFELVRSFPASGLGMERIDVYRLQLPVDELTERMIPFQTLGETTELSVQPIPPRPHPARPHPARPHSARPSWQRE